ncbi:MAG: hypothetical protein IJ595_10655 [Oscillospiraceae bacterium]|nr:hypothetical protein [Oscillospiraceae bacterium]
MANVKSTCLRFNLDKEQYRRAWEILQASGKSYTQTVTAALIEYDERHSRLTDDPYFENREREDRFVEQIVSAVEQSLGQALPGFMAGCLMNMVQPYHITPQAVQPASEETEEQSGIKDIFIDWDYLESISDE